MKNKVSFLDRKPVIYGMIALCVVLMFISYMQQKKRAQTKEAANLPFYNIQVSDVADGTYLGQTYTSFMHVELEITVLDHTITDIQIVKNEGSRGINVAPIVDEMIKQNKTVVPAIKGEEIASMVFISCADSALRKGTASYEEPESSEPAAESNQN